MVPQPEDRPTLRAEEVFELFDIDRRTGYAQVRAGTFPVAPIRIGRLIRFPTAQVRRILDLEVDVGPPPAERGDAPAGVSGGVEATDQPGQESISRRRER